MTWLVQTPLFGSARSDALPPPKLLEKEQAEYDRVLAHFSNPSYVLPNVDGAEDGALMEVERMWLSHECILRYIRGTKHDVSATIKRLESTLKWRREFGLYTHLTPSHVETEAVTGKLFLHGRDSQGRPALYFCPSKQNIQEYSRFVQFVFWFFERSFEFMDPGVESITVMVDFAEKTSIPSFSDCGKVIHILQTHYPERLGTCVIAHLPWLLQPIWRLIVALMDPVTRSKLVSYPVLDDDGLWRSTEARDQSHNHAKLFEPDQLLQEGWEGKVPFTYEHETYWSDLLATSEGRRNDMTRVWRELGGTVGIREWDVKVGVRDGQMAPRPAVDGEAV